MHIDEFVYTLPQERIAQYPLLKRDQARLMIVRRQTGEIIHERFFHLGKYLPKNSLIVLNNSRVIPARLFGRKERTQGKVEIFLLERLSDGYSFKTLLRPLKRIRNGDVITFNGHRVRAEVVDVKKRLVRFNRRDILRHLKNIGHIPLPPYIKRADEKVDREYYQTVYARHAGSVAAPTAGLHFTKALLEDLKAHGHPIARVTLHINYATFRLVEEEDIREHKMHVEKYSVGARAQKDIARAKSSGRPVVAVGTTSCRVLESMAQGGQRGGETDLFIYPGYAFRQTDALLTNFHLPRSTLLMLVYAFAGPALMRRAYAEAIKEKYRFFSYGDAMLIV